MYIFFQDHFQRQLNPDADMCFAITGPRICFLSATKESKTGLSFLAYIRTP